MLPPPPGGGSGRGAAAPRDSFLSRLGIGEFLRVPVRKLSGGMKKRLAIACAMANRPPILLLDEPTAALDIPCKEEIHEYLSFYKSLGGILLFVTHDLLDLTMCDRLLLLRDGAISPFAKPDDPAALAKAIGGAFSPAGEGRTADTPAAAGGGKA